MQIFNLKSASSNRNNYIDFVYRQLPKSLIKWTFCVLHTKIRTRSSRRITLQVVLLLFLSFPLSAQTSDTIAYQVLKTFPLQATFVSVDALQQLYIATAEGELYKYDKTGEILFEYSNDRLGNIGVVDATNPFNILVYYPDLATVILLDRTLSEIKEINLFSLAIFEPQAK